MSETKILGKICFDQKKLEQDIEKIRSFPPLHEEYSEYSIGTWTNNSLMNIDGDYHNTQYSDFEHPAMLTRLGKKVTYLMSVVSGYFDTDHLRMVRTRNLTNGLLIPHVDYVELSENKSRYIRILIPLNTCLSSFHYDEHKGLFHMRKGEIWMLDASITHGAYNLSGDDRLILCLDFQYDEVNPHFSKIFKCRSICDNTITPLWIKRGTLDQDEIHEYLAEHSKKMITAHDIREIIFDMAKLFLTYDLPIHTIYTFLLKISALQKNRKLHDYCKKMHIYFTKRRKIGERFAPF